jgi:hypothetical protein
MVSDYFVPDQPFVPYFDYQACVQPARFAEKQYTRILFILLFTIV